MVLYTSVIKNVLAPFRMETVGDTVYVLHDMQFEYGSGGHLPMIICCAIYALSFGVATPILILRAYLKGMKAKDALTRLMNNRRFGFISMGYKQEFVWWEMVYVYRRL
eukprot:5419622-Prymnesium_polylepis.2